MRQGKWGKTSDIYNKDNNNCKADSLDWHFIFEEDFDEGIPIASDERHEEKVANIRIALVTSISKWQNKSEDLSSERENERINRFPITTTFNFLSQKLLDLRNSGYFRNACII